MLPIGRDEHRIRMETEIRQLEGQVEALREERDRLRALIGGLYVQRGQDVNTLRNAIRRAFHESTKEGTADAPR